MLSMLIVVHPRSGVEYNFVVSVCMYVFLCICQTITFESLDVGSSYLHIRHLHGILVKFVYEGHRVKYKVTGAKK